MENRRARDPKIIVTGLVGAAILVSILFVGNAEVTVFAEVVSGAIRAILLAALLLALLLVVWETPRKLILHEVRLMPLRWVRLSTGLILLAAAIWPWAWTGNPLLIGLAKFIPTFAGLLLVLTSRIANTPPARTSVAFRACRKPEDDLLDFRHHAKELSKLLATERPPTFGITGAWGSGKTSFINLVQYYLKQDGDHPFAFFNPWKSRDREEAWHLFARALDDCFHPLASHAKPLTRLMLGILKAIPGVPVPLGEAFLDFIQRGSRHDKDALQGLESRLARHLRGRHLFVLVDDADRAEADVTKGVFAMVDEMTQLDISCTFLFAIDRTRLKEAFATPEQAEGFFLKVLPRHQAVPTVDERQTLDLLEPHCIDSPRLASALPTLVAVLPDGLRAKLSFAAHAASFEKIYLQEMKPAGCDWTSLFLFLLLEHQLDGFRSHCRSEKIAEKLQEWNVLEMFDQEAKEKGLLQQHILEFASKFSDLGPSQEWTERAVKAWIESFDPVASRSLSPKFVVEIGPAWIALGDEEFAAMLGEWLADPERLSSLAETHKRDAVSVPEVIDSFLLRALTLYESAGFNASSQRYITQRQTEGKEAADLLRAFATWATSPAFEREFASLNEKRSEQLYDQFRKRPSWAIDSEINPTELHRQVLSRCVDHFPIRHLAPLHFRGVRDNFANEGEDDLSVKTRKVLHKIECEVHLRYGREVIAAFRTPTGLAPELASDYREAYADSLTCPDKWLIGENIGLFRELVAESAQNEHIRDQLRRILGNILPGMDDDPKSFTALFKKHPEFVKGVWEGTHAEMLVPAYRDALLQRRDRATALEPSIRNELSFPGESLPD